MASEYEELCGVLRKQSTPNIETAIRFLRVVSDGDRTQLAQSSMHP